MAGSKNVLVHRSELDRINVFPIPDGDTGTNLALTMSAMAETAASLEIDSLSEVAHGIAEAGVVSARGNSGMMFAHFFLGFADGLEGLASATATELAPALRRAADSLYQAVERPVEGTILTVVREFSEEAERIADRVSDLRDFGKRLPIAARLSLERTPDLLPVLKEAHVVDAGAKGFVRFLEGGVAALEDGRAPEAQRQLFSAEHVPNAVAVAEFPDETDRAYRFCTELLVRGEPLPEKSAMAAAVSPLGGSLIITRADTVAKLHIHTNEPESVTTVLEGMGGSVELIKAEDMRAQHRKFHASASRIRVVTDTTCDLPSETIIEHDITIVPLTVLFGDQAFLDQIDISHEEFQALLVDPEQPHPTTSQPAPGDFEAAFKRAAEDADELVAVFVSGARSGTLRQGEGAARSFSGARVHVFDSRTASLGLGFQVLKAAELASQGKRVEEILDGLERARDRSGVLLTVDTLDYLRRSGRVSRGKALLAGFFDLKPILTVDTDGAVSALDRVRGRAALLPRVVELLKSRIPRERERLQIGVVHVLAPEVARSVGASLESEFAPDEIWVRPATSVLAAHTGPGAWAVIYQFD